MSYSRFAATVLCGISFHSQIGVALSAPFSVGNILVSHGISLEEYTLDGTLIQSMTVPYPAAVYYQVKDVVQDRFGRAHVLNVGPGSPYPDYLSTYDPRSNEWLHTPIPLGHIGNINDGDLGIHEDFVFRRGLRIDINSFAIKTWDIGWNYRPSETSVGLDGLLYSINTGNRVQRTDPNTLWNTGPLFALRDQKGLRVDADGLTASATNAIYAATSDGHIIKFNSEGKYLGDIDTGPMNFNEINIRKDGVIVAGDNSGRVAVTNIDFSSLFVFDVGSDFALTYAAFVNYTVPEPSSFMILVIGIGFLARIVR